MRSANLLLALEDNHLREDARSILGQLDAGCSLEEHNPSDWENLIQHVGTRRPEIVLLEMGSVRSDLGSAVREIRQCAPQTKIVAVHYSSDPQSILAAMRAGANEFVHPPLADNLVPAVERIVSSQDQEQRAGMRGQVVGFLSAKGGCGATTLACHVAADLQRQTGKKVALADLDLTSGMVAFLMKATGSYSILDAVQNLSRLDESLWKALAPEWKPGITVIPTPESYAEENALHGEDLREVIRFMRTQHDWIVLDLGRSFNALLAALYGELDQLLIVSVMEVTALQGLKAIIRKLEERGENVDKLRLVLNRTPKTMDITREELQKILGRPLYATLPNDYPSLYESYSAGTLLSPNSKLGQHFASLSSKIAGVQPVQQKKKFGLFG
jgi:pilus assembly protein CpaE